MFCSVAGPEAAPPPEEVDSTSERDARADAEAEAENARAAGEAALAGGGEAGGGEELQVSVRLLEEGALVRWQRARGDEARCAVHWYEGDRLLHVAHTYQDHLLGECTRGAGGGAVRGHGGS